MANVKGLRVHILNPETRVETGGRKFQTVKEYRKFMDDPNHMTSSRLFNNLCGCLHKELQPNGDIIAYYEFGEASYEQDYIQRVFGYTFRMTKKTCNLNEFVPNFDAIWEDLNSSTEVIEKDFSYVSGIKEFTGTLPAALRNNY